MLIEQITTLLTQLVTIYLPVNDVNIKITMSIAISSIISAILYYVWSKLKAIRFYRPAIKERYLIIENSNKIYIDFINYLYEKFTDNTKGCKIDKTNNSYKLMIEEITNNELIDYHDGKKITISFIEKQTKEKNESNNLITKDIILKTDSTIQHLEEYLKTIIRSINSTENKKINMYKLKKTGNGKNAYIEWFKNNFVTNKTMKNTIVSSEVQRLFYDDIVKFINNEKYYYDKGLPYKRGYLLYGEPGCGKTSVVKAVANDLKLPIFILDLNTITSNAELVSIINDINFFIVPKQKYLLVFEDFDRTNIFEGLSRRNNYYYNSQRSNNKSKITQDCILNILDGIDESYGRIVIITTNDFETVNCLKSLIRPGRIDAKINITYCNLDQVKKILRFYFEIQDDVDISVNNEIHITPAQLIQLIYLTSDFDKTIKILNNKINFENSSIEKEIFESEKKEHSDLTNPTVSGDTKKRSRVSRTNSDRRRWRPVRAPNKLQRIESVINNRKNRIQKIEQDLNDNTMRTLRLDALKIKQKIDEINKDKLAEKMKANNTKKSGFRPSFRQPSASRGRTSRSAISPDNITPVEEEMSDATIDITSSDLDRDE